MSQIFLSSSFSSSPSSSSCSSSFLGAECWYKTRLSDTDRTRSHHWVKCLFSLFTRLLLKRYISMVRRGPPPLKAECVVGIFISAEKNASKISRVDAASPALRLLFCSLCVALIFSFFIEIIFSLLFSLLLLLLLLGLWFLVLAIFYPKGAATLSDCCLFRLGTENWVRRLRDNGAFCCRKLSLRSHFRYAPN